MLAVLTVAVLGPMGGIALLGIPFNMVTILLPLILVSLSVCDVTHVVNAFHGERRERSAEDAARAAVSVAVDPMSVDLHRDGRRHVVACGLLGGADPPDGTRDECRSRARLGVHDDDGAGTCSCSSGGSRALQMPAGCRGYSAPVCCRCLRAAGAGRGSLWPASWSSRSRG